jgi:hypothetical protein
MCGDHAKSGTRVQIIFGNKEHFLCEFGCAGWFKTRAGFASRRLDSAIAFLPRAKP